MDYNTASLALLQKLKGQLEIKVKTELKSKDDLSTSYTPGIAEPCREIAKNPDLAYTYTEKQNLIAVVTDGSAVLGLGNIGALAGYPVMSGKCALFKTFGNVDAIPICLATQDTEEIIQTVKNIAPTFGGINLEDIAAPRCFEIEKRLIEELDIPVFHDDQHGTAIVVLAGLINALKVVNKKIEDIYLVINGAGAAGLAIANLLNCVGLGKSICTSVREVIMVDSKGVIYEGRGDLNDYKKR